MDLDLRHKHRTLLNDMVELYVTLTESKELSPSQKIFFEHEEAAAGNLDKLVDMIEAKETWYFDRLKAMAQVNLSAYHEFMNPEEPPAEHHEMMCRDLEDLESGKIHNLFVSWPPGAAKSSYSSRSFVQWYLGRNPHNNVLSAGYADSFVRNEFSKPNRNAIQSDEYHEVFEDVNIDPKSRASDKWDIEGKEGKYYVRSVDARTSGIRANLICLDDILGSVEQALSITEREKANRWLVSDVLPRALPQRRLLVIGTRWHSEDPIGYLSDIIETNPDKFYGEYKIVNVSAEGGPDNPVVKEPGKWLWEDFYGAEHYQAQKATMSPAIWSASYKGEPIDASGNIISEEDFVRYSEIPDKDGKYTISIDTAEKSKITSNRTAMTVYFEPYGEKCAYMVDAWIGRAPMIEVIKMIRTLESKWGVSEIIIEDANMGAQIIENYSNKFSAFVTPSVTQGKGSKEFNVDTYLSPAVKTGWLKLPEKGPDWLLDVLTEIIAFPEGSNDDIPDSCAQFCRHRRKVRNFGSKSMSIGSRANTAKSNVTNINKDKTSKDRVNHLHGKTGIPVIDDLIRCL